MAAEGVVTREAGDFVAQASQKAAYFGDSDSSSINTGHVPWHAATESRHNAASIDA